MAISRLQAPVLIISTHLALLFSCAASTPPSIIPIVHDGDSCAGSDTYLSKSCGMSIGNRVTGTIVQTNERGDQEAVHLARLYLAHANPAAGPPAVLTSTDSKGRFVLTLNFSISDTVWCRSGIARTERYVVPEDILVKARDCVDLELKLGPETTGQTWGMKCNGKPSG